MITKTQARKLGRPDTLDMRYKHNLDYVNSVDMKDIKTVAKDYCYMIFSALGAVFLGFILFVLMVGNTEAYTPDEYKYYGVDNYQDYARSLRVETCERVYQANKDFVDNTYIHLDQDVVTRCATMMTLIGALESDYYTSHMYLTKNNAYGIKDWYLGGFKTYNSTYEGDLDFATKYLVGRGDDSFKGHKNRTISEFVYTWSMTDRETYIDFVSSKYWTVYNKISKLKKGVKGTD